MITYVPDYYPAFHCIADRCRHSCCIGWEIDIDPDTLAYYHSLGGALGERLITNIDETDEGASFRLNADERCPFLNGSGLCDLIISLGEDALCEICADHPRFRNFFDSRTELGLGLCCEEAAELILTHVEMTTLIPLTDDGEPSEPKPEEEAFFTFRDAILTILQDRALPIAERLGSTLALVSVSPEMIFADDAHWAAVYRSLEMLDLAWGSRLEAWQRQAAPVTLPDTPDVILALEQLAVYFMYRHLAAALDDGRYTERVAFALLAVHTVASLAAVDVAANGGQTLSALLDAARSYSAEIEYSTENVEMLLDELEKVI